MGADSLNDRDMISEKDLGSPLQIVSPTLVRILSEQEKTDREALNI